MPEKYEREIEEILSRFDAAPPPSGRVLTPLPPLPGQRPRRPRGQGWSPSFRVSLSPSSLMVAALCLAVLSYPLQWVYPGAVAGAGLLAAGMLVLAIVLSVARGSRARPSQTWRGQPVELGGGFSASSLSRRWRRWKAHRRFRDPRWN